MRCVLLLLAAALVPAAAQADRVAKPAVRVAEGSFYAPQFSPDGDALLVTGPRLQGLWLLGLDGRAPRTITTEERAGVAARFLPDGRVAFEARRAGATRAIAVAGDGAMQQVALPEPAVFAHGDRIYVRTPDGVVPVGTGDRFFAPRMSPDGRRVAFIGLRTGIYVYDLDSGSLEHVGTGTAPAWSPDSAALAFERTHDDGHDVVASDIWLWQPGAAATPFIAGDARIERRPSWSADGRALAFDDDRGAIYVAPVEVTR